MGERHTALFKGGTDLDDLASLIGDIYRNHLKVENHDVYGRDCRLIVEREVLAGRPVILGFEGIDIGHFVVVVGVRWRGESVESRQVDRFLVLDPAAPAPLVAAWNGMVTARGIGGIHPYEWWSTDGEKARRVALFGAVSLHSEA